MAATKLRLEFILSPADDPAASQPESYSTILQSTAASPQSYGRDSYHECDTLTPTTELSYYSRLPTSHELPPIAAVSHYIANPIQKNILPSPQSTVDFSRNSYKASIPSPPSSKRKDAYGGIMKTLVASSKKQKHNTDRRLSQGYMTGVVKRRPRQKERKDVRGKATDEQKHDEQNITGINEEQGSIVLHQNNGRWKDEENLKIIRMRGDGKTWANISKDLPGRSTIACRLHYQNYLERQSIWTPQLLSRLAHLYERHKKKMWAEIARDLDKPWRTIEYMHWQLGVGGMAELTGAREFLPRYV